MVYEFVINYKTGERETGTTVAFSLDEAVKNIINFEDINDINSITFNYTIKQSAFFDNADIIKIMEE